MNKEENEFIQRMEENVMSNYFANGSTTSPKNSNRCGTCIYWNGQKNVLVDLIEYDMYENARCNNFNSPAYGQEVSAEHSCGCKEDF